MIKLLPDHTPALTVLQPFGSFTEEETKIIETRVWKTDYRGDLLICAGAAPHKGLYWHVTGWDGLNEVLMCAGYTNRRK